MTDIMAIDVSQRTFI